MPLSFWSLAAAVLGLAVSGAAHAQVVTHRDVGSHMAMAIIALRT